MLRLHRLPEINDSIGMLLGIDIVKGFLVTSLEDCNENAETLATSIRTSKAAKAIILISMNMLETIIV